MTTPFRGLYRTTAWGYVTNNTMAFNVPEAEYRAFGYEPDYDSLPWKESYVAAKAGKAAQAEQTRMPTRPSPAAPAFNGSLSDALSNAT
jgi:hypothetical protein